MKKIYFISSLVLGLSARMWAHSPTWTNTIAAILYKNCTSCHHPGGLAPFSLMTYDDAYNNRYSIKASVGAKNMPPWPPDQNYNALAHARTLTEHEIQDIAEWVDNFAPFGNASEAPTPPRYTNEGAIPNPDVTFRIPTYTVQSNQDIYRCFPMRSGLTSDKFISGLECLPGNASIVHHVLIFADTSNRCWTLDAADSGIGYTSFGGVGSNTAQLIGSWVPGSAPQFYPRGMGVKLPANANIIMQIHYPGGVMGQLDSTALRLKLTTGNIREVSIKPILNHSISLTNGPLFIPANTSKTFYAQFNIPVNVSVLSIAPHMHLIGKKIKSYFVNLQGDTTKLIHIPNWDFHWQGQYNFKKVLKVPAGARLYGEAFYDNTVNNSLNPNHPPRDVALGEATTDEMMLIYFAYMPYQVGDENIVLDSTIITKINDMPLAKMPMNCFPNPAQKLLHLSMEVDISGIYQVEIYDSKGTFVMSALENQSWCIGKRQLTIPIEQLSAGNYFVRVRSNEAYSTRTFVKVE